MYDVALEMCGLTPLSTRRLQRCNDFSLNCIKHEQNKRYFPLNPNLKNQNNIRNRERFSVNFARTKTYQKITIPYCQRLLNTHFGQIQEEGEEGGGGA